MKEMVFAGIAAIVLTIVLSIINHYTHDYVGVIALMLYYLIYNSIKLDQLTEIH